MIWNETPNWIGVLKTYDPWCNVTSLSNVLRHLPHPLTLEVTSRYVGTNSLATSAVLPEEEEMASPGLSSYINL